MGVIYRDGVAYGGISSIAGNVSYDNSTSHLQSSTVQNAITELKNIIDSEEYTSIAFVNSLPAATNAQYNTLYIVDNNNDSVFELWVIKTTLGQKAWVAVGDNSKIAALQESVAALQTEISGLSYIASASIDNATGNLVLTDSDNNTVTLQLDSTPTANSKKPITSGAVYTALDNQVGKKEYVNNTFKGEIFNTYSGSGKNIASGFGSHAEGVRTKASDNYSHAEGFSTTASGESSHAEGFDTEAWGAYSHAEGRETDAHAAYSHVSGWGTRANTAASTVIGTYNVIDGTSSSDPKHLFIIGNGTGTNARSNVLEVSDSYMNLNGTLKINNTAIGSLAMKDADDIHREMSDVEYETLSNAQKNDGTEYFVYETSEDNRSVVCKDANGNFKYKVFIYGVVSNGTPGWDKTATDADAPTTPPTKSDPVLYTSIMLGYTTSEKTTYFSVWKSRVLTAYGKTVDKDASDCYYVLTDNPNSPYKLVTLDGEFGGNVAETLTTDIVTLGTKPTGNRYIKAYDKSYGDITIDLIPTQGSSNAVSSDGVYRYTAGQKEYVNGVPQGEIFNTYSGVLKNEATGTGSHAEGTDTIASGDFSHAEGASSQATGDYGHAEGVNSRATADGAHAEGGDTQANGVDSHAEGGSTQANGRYSHSEGTDTIANGYCSHSGGISTIANSRASTVIGKYNIADGTGENDPKHLFIIGNGVRDSERSNIVEVDSTALNVNGDIKQNGVSITSTPHTELTQAQYDALQNPDAGTEYFITDASSGVTVSALESRLAALEMQETVYYINGVQRVPLYSQNITQVVKVNDNTVDWYFLEPTSQKTYKARVTAQGEGNTRTNPLIIVTEVSS